MTDDQGNSKSNDQSNNQNQRPFTPSRGQKISNRVVSALIRTGVPMGPMVLLTVPGRKSGVLRTTPVAVNEHADGWSVIAPFGQVDWVKNLRAAGGGTIRRRGRRYQVVASELAPAQGGPILVHSLKTANASAKKVIMPQFATPLDAPAAAWEAEVANHPVFLLRKV
jgi:deazaflavin-dependent oxidoreductase (nitroreductase family)